MLKTLRLYFVPGLVIQAILVGGGYATGRELIEFFLSQGPLTGLLGMAVTATLFSLGAVVCFLLAHRFRTHDYDSFTRLFLGRAHVLFEIGYLATLILVLAVVSAAAGSLLTRAFAWPELAGIVAFMIVTAALVAFGSTAIERIISAWSLVFYATYGLMFALVIANHGERLVDTLAVAPLRLGAGLWNGLTYTAYNIPLLPVLIFVARNFTTSRQAIIAGALTGPLVLLPGFAFLLSLTAFYPDVLSAPLPVSVVLDALGNPYLNVIMQAVIMGALIKTAVGLLHGLNERLSRAAVDRQRQIPRWFRPGAALLVMLIAVFGAAAVGLVDLIASGYRFSALYFLAVFVIPLFTLGVWRASLSPAAVAPGRS